MYSPGPKIDQLLVGSLSLKDCFHGRITKNIDMQ